MPINHGLQELMKSMFLQCKRLRGLNLASREIVSMIERLSVTSFTGDQRVPYAIWRQLGILSGLQQRGFPHVNDSVLNLWSRTLRGEYWLSSKDSNEPVRFSHLRAVRYHYGDIMWAQCTIQSRLELFLSMQTATSSGVTIGECIRVVTHIIKNQFIPEVCRSISAHWDKVYLDSVRNAREQEQRCDALFLE